MQTAQPTVTINTENMSQAIAQMTQLGQSSNSNWNATRQAARKRLMIRAQKKVYASKKKMARRKANKVARASRKKNRA